MAAKRKPAPKPAISNTPKETSPEVEAKQAEAAETMPEIEEMPVPPAPQPEPPMDSATKVRLIGNLANISQNQELIALLDEQPNGSQIYQLFVEAIDRKLSEIMGGKATPEDTAAEAVSLAQAVQGAHQSLAMMRSLMDQFRTLMVGFMQTPLVDVLTMMNKNLGGPDFAFQPPVEQPNVQMPVPQAPAPQAPVPVADPQQPAVGVQQGSTQPMRRRRQAIKGVQQGGSETSVPARHSRGGGGLNSF